jgi:hypothetical protein
MYKVLKKHSFGPDHLEQALEHSIAKAPQKDPIWGCTTQILGPSHIIHSVFDRSGDT